jgi:hypothetical protein
MKWIVLGSNSDHRAQAFGPFATEDVASRWAKRQERAYPAINWLPMPICPKSTATPLARLGLE